MCGGVPSYLPTTGESPVTQARPSPSLKARSRESRVVVVGTDLLAGALTRALATYGLEARHVRPQEPDLEMAFDWRPRLALLDVRALTRGGIELVARFRQHDVGVCILDGESPAQEVKTWLEAGVSAMIDKRTPFEALVRTIDPLLDHAPESQPRVSASEPVQPALHRAPASSGHPHPEVRDSQRGLVNILTERERHVLAELMEGHCADEIASAGSVSISTVRSQIKSILQKLGVSSQLAAVALARRAGWSMAQPSP